MMMIETLREKLRMQAGRASERYRAIRQGLITGAGQAMSLAKSVTSARVPDPVFHERMAICLGQTGCRRSENGREYCGACGCPGWRMAELEMKLRFAGWTCPRKRFGQWKET